MLLEIDKKLMLESINDIEKEEMRVMA